MLHQKNTVTFEVLHHVNTKDWSSVPADGATLTSEVTFCMENSVIVNVYLGDDETHCNEINRNSAFYSIFFLLFFHIEIWKTYIFGESTRPSTITSWYDGMGHVISLRPGCGTAEFWSSQRRKLCRFSWRVIFALESGVVIGIFAD